MQAMLTYNRSYYFIRTAQQDSKQNCESFSQALERKTEKTYKR